METLSVTEFVLDDPDLFLSPAVTQHSHNQAIIICLCNLMRCYSDPSIILQLHLHRRRRWDSDRWHRFMAKKWLAYTKRQLPFQMECSQGFFPTIAWAPRKKSFKPHYCGYTHFAIHKVIFSQNRQWSFGKFHPFKKIAIWRTRPV